MALVNEKFKEPFERHGAGIDRKNIEEFCHKAGFHVDKKLKTNDITKEEIKTLFETVSNQDFRDYDAFVCFISSHGATDGIYGIDGGFISVNEIVCQFKNNASLAGKPKLFLAQYCRGKNVDDGVVASDGPCLPTSFPIEADILVAYSSSYGYTSYRNFENGSWFITTLINVLSKHAHDVNLTDILTIVNHTMASEKGSKKQMPCFTSTLTKAVYFEMPKSSE